MRQRKWGGSLVIVLLIVTGWFLLPLDVCQSADRLTLRTQGLINPGGNLKARYLLINEMRICIRPDTQVMDHYGRTIRLTELTPKKWVYLEAKRDSLKESFEAQKIYLLPYYVSPKEKNKFAFMK